MNAQNQFPAISDKAISGQIVKTVDGREVHRFLGAKKDYTTWIKDRIKKYGFVENVDYVVFTNFGENPTGGRPATEYFLTIGMGKSSGWWIALPRVGKSANTFCRSRKRQQRQSR